MVISRPPQQRRVVLRRRKTVVGGKCTLPSAVLAIVKSQPLEQKAQLSQRDRAMIRVVEYFAKSLKVIRNDC